MKYRMLALILIVALMGVFAPVEALAQTKAASCPVQLVANAKQTGENKISFTVWGSKSKPVSYRVYVYSKANKPSWKTLRIPGRMIAQGRISTCSTVTVKVPAPAKVYIASNTGSIWYDPNQVFYPIKEQVEDDYCSVNFTQTSYSQTIKWTQARINDYKKGKFIEATMTTIVDTAFGGVVGAIKCGAVCAIGGAITAAAFTVSLNAIGSVTTDIASLPNIRTVPIEGYSWRYKFTPSGNGFYTHLEVYNTSNRLEKTFSLGYTSLAN